eukprot:1139251-Pelagomonas_calceolata.AAC.4
MGWQFVNWEASCRKLAGQVLKGAVWGKWGSSGLASISDMTSNWLYPPASEPGCSSELHVIYHTYH